MVQSPCVVVCIIDRRYGPAIPGGESAKSATHIEVDHARKNSKPVFYFIRDRAYTEFEQLRHNASYKTYWVEPNNEQARDRWRGFVQQIAALPMSNDYSNWLDQFSTAVDLCDKVESRLVAAFPQHATSRALAPERFVRLTFVPTTFDGFYGDVSGHFRNDTEVLALDVVSGWRLENEDQVVIAQGALAPGRQLVVQGQQNHSYSVPRVPSTSYRSLYCEYENIYGDRYRVEVALGVDIRSVDLPDVIPGRVGHARPPQGTHEFLIIQSERVFAATGVAGARMWIQILAPPDRAEIPPPTVA